MKHRVFCLWLCLSLGLSFLETMTTAEGQTVSITLIEERATWKYLDNGSNQGTAWRGRTFNDSSWKTGSAPLGYGDCGLPPLKTLVNDGPDTNRFITTYFRHTVEIAEPTVYTGLTLSLRRDDGAVVYVNGSEVWRTNMPAGTITSTTRATTTVEPVDEARFFTAQLAPGVLVPGSNVVAVEVHQQNPTSSDLCFDLQLTAAVEPLIEAGASWKYLDNGSNQGTAWRGRTFNDSSWKTGPAPLGYGDCGLPPLKTLVNDGPDTNRFITTYFRHRFEVVDPSDYTVLNFRLRRDDGAVVYVNGSEVWRTNMPSKPDMPTPPPITSTTPASTTVDVADEARFFTAQLTPGNLVPGSNVVAVEVHQRSPTSSDLCFDLQLIGLPVPILVGAGDIAVCGSTNTGDEATAALLDTIPGVVFTAGDLAYEDGSWADFNGCYNPTWGRHKDRTRPAPGNHEYVTPGAAEYFTYFDDAYFGNPAAGTRGQGYYSYNLGAWHIVVLNSNCAKVGGCDSGSAQGIWLDRDLRDHATNCTLAYFHHPLFTAGPHQPAEESVQPLWETLYAHGVDVVVVGHDHNYQRFKPQDPDGNLDLQGGIRQFIVGTGGREHRTPTRNPATLEAKRHDTYGVLKLTLHPTSYGWKFVPEAGKTFTDSGSAACH
jgi:Calcineurin-like phosphoesterase